VSQADLQDLHRRYIELREQQAAAGEERDRLAADHARLQVDSCTYYIPARPSEPYVISPL